jgi:hypothetical protein
MARLAHSAHDQTRQSLHSAGKSSESKGFQQMFLKRHHRKFDAPAETERSAVLEDSRSAMPRKIAVSQNVLAILAVLFFHTCSTSGDQEGVEI